MQWKSKVRAAVVERKHPTVIMYDEQWAASTANDDHARGLQLFQRRHANEIIAAGPRGVLDPRFGHENQSPARGYSSSYNGRSGQKECALDISSKLRNP